ncbi:MYB TRANSCRIPTION FACTOR [Salix purpurea]|uniref:MYB TRANSCRIPTION FACTOR n=1 Tax=Salix purpurea TaxID=77065 RepID=A0A9Q0ZNJ3_SALPP|nr:MYB TRANSCRIPTION FACTOR [Salix purpurea]
MARRKRERCLTVHGKRNNFQVQYSADHHHHRSSRNGSTAPGSNFGFFRPQVSLDYGSKLGFQDNIIGRKEGTFIQYSSSSSLYPNEGRPPALNESLHCTYHPSSTIYGGDSYKNVAGKQIPNSKKVVPSNPFAFTSSGDGHGSNKEKTTIERQLVRLSSNRREPAALWKSPMASQQEENDHGGQLKNQDVAFIDFLGVGIS